MSDGGSGFAGAGLVAPEQVTAQLRPEAGVGPKEELEVVHQAAGLGVGLGARERLDGVKKVVQGHADMGKGPDGQVWVSVGQDILDDVQEEPCGAFALLVGELRRVQELDLLQHNLDQFAASLEIAAGQSLQF